MPLETFRGVHRRASVWRTKQYRAPFTAIALPNSGPIVWSILSESVGSGSAFVSTISVTTNTPGIGSSTTSTIDLAPEYPDFIVAKRALAGVFCASLSEAGGWVDVVQVAVHREGEESGGRTFELFRARQ